SYDGDLAYGVGFDGESVHHSINARQRIREGKRQWLNTDLQWDRGTTSADRQRSHSGYELEPASIAHSLLHSVWRDPTDAAPYNLVERNGLAERNSRQNTGLRNNIVPLHVVTRVRLGITASLRLTQGSGVVETPCHPREDIICRCI